MDIYTFMYLCFNGWLLWRMFEGFIDIKVLVMFHVFSTYGFTQLMLLLIKEQN